MPDGVEARVRPISRGRRGRLESALLGERLPVEQLPVDARFDGGENNWRTDDRSVAAFANCRPVRSLAHGNSVLVLCGRWDLPDEVALTLHPVSERHEQPSTA